ncbi:MAG: ester cyclase [Sneathiella sp.]|nr:ester cyclase [Sneathiella sp.]
MKNSSIVEKNRKIAKAFMADVHSNDVRKFSTIDTTVAQNVVCHGFPGGNPTDPQSYKNWFYGFRDSFTNLEFENTTIVVDESSVAVRWVVSCDHTGPFAGVEATNRRVTFDGIVIYRIEAGLISEVWLQINELLLLSQVGALGRAAA